MMVSMMMILMIMIIIIRQLLMTMMKNEYKDQDDKSTWPRKQLILCPPSFNDQADLEFDKIYCFLIVFDLGSFEIDLSL